MLHHPTLDQLKELRLHGMADAFTEMQGKDRNVLILDGDGREVEVRPTAPG